MEKVVSIESASPRALSGANTTTGTTIAPSHKLGAVAVRSRASTQERKGRFPRATIAAGGACPSKIHDPNGWREGETRGDERFRRRPPRADACSDGASIRPQRPDGAGGCCGS